MFNVCPNLIRDIVDTKFLNFVVLLNQIVCVTFVFDSTYVIPLLPIIYILALVLAD